MNAKGAAAQDLKLATAASRGLAKAWSRGWLTEPPLDPASLIAKAERREKGRLDPGEWEQALALLTDDLTAVAALNPLGRAMAHGQLVGILRQRIRAAGIWREHPHILDIPIERPVIVLGQMRSGTTLTHRLLACDPQFSFTRLHESLFPTGRGQLHAHLVRAGLERLNPHLASAHPTSVAGAEEEFGLHAFSFHGAMFDAQWHVPNFARWDNSRDLAPVYREFRRLLQTLRWRRRDPAEKIQLLKAPQFMQDLPALLDEFPDARIILLVREPDDVMASSASLVWHQRRVQSDQADPRSIGAEWKRKTELREKRAGDGLRGVSPSSIVTVPFPSLASDWASEIRRIYAQLGLELEPLVLARMTRVASSSAHRGHHYSAAQFGLD